MTLPYPGFIFWGLFLVIGAVLLGYVVWMFRAERTDRQRKTRNHGRDR